MKRLAVILAIFYSQYTLAELLDPRTRDEDLSNTTVTVDVTEDKGLYKYVYTINNPDTNKGTIVG